MKMIDAMRQAGMDNFFIVLVDSEGNMVYVAGMQYMPTIADISALQSMFESNKGNFEYEGDTKSLGILISSYEYLPDGVVEYLNTELVDGSNTTMPEASTMIH